jgi:hypothetical protein
MLIGCSDCEPAATCAYKVLIAVITPAGYTGSGSTSNPTASPVDGSYCPGVYTVSDGVATTTCASIENIINWLLAQYTNFQNDSDYPWNTYTTAFFQNGSSTAPYATVGPGSFTGFGAPSDGSNYGTGGALTALNGTAAGNICASAQLVAMQMSGNLFITPLNVTGVTESCLEPATSASCFQSGTYYIPLPTYDLCSDPSGGTIQISYVPAQTGNNVDCLPDYTGGAYTTCQTPDPFFGSDPP